MLEIGGERFAPSRPSTWLYGESGSTVEVWVIAGDCRTLASVLIEAGGRAIVLLNARWADGPEAQHCLTWALHRTAVGESGFFMLRVQHCAPSRN